jgi:hypothetical protein
MFCLFVALETTGGQKKYGIVNVLVQLNAFK